MSTIPTLNVRPETAARLATFVKDSPFQKVGFCTLAIEFAMEYVTKFGRLPYLENLNEHIPSADIGNLLVAASALPGMTREVITSHLTRFPAVTTEKYRLVIQELLRRQASPEGLKNPEAAAYGLCKQIQAGKPITTSKASTVSPTPATTATDDLADGEEVPASFSAPY